LALRTLPVARADAATGRFHDFMDAVRTFTATVPEPAVKMVVSL